MTYSNKFVASIQVGKDYLREEGEHIYMPFGTEYSIFLKNLENRNAVVDVIIDGKSVLSGSLIVLPAGQSMTLQGFLEGNVVENKFKFIERIKEIEEYRGINPEDGIIIITFKFEKEYSPVYYYASYMPVFKEVNYDDYTISSTSGAPCRHGTSSGSWSAANDSIESCYTSDAGITVKGEETSQVFGHASYFETELISHSIIFKLHGINNKKNISQPITSKTYIVCSSCGQKNDGLAKYCNRCGTHC